MLASIASNHHAKNFYPKCNKIINEYKDIIKKNYSNQEIFSIFLHNEPIILFLSKENIFQFDEDIKYLINNCDHQEQREYFFSPEATNDKDQEEGQNHTQICKIIRSDRLEDFVTYINQHNVQLNSNIPPSQFETNSFLKEGEISILQYTTFYGSIEIFKHIIEKDPTLLNETIWEFAFLSQNKEIVEIIVKNNVLPPKDNFESCLLRSIKDLRTDNFDIILNRFALEPSQDIIRPPPKHGNPYLYQAVISFNYYIILKLISEIEAKDLYNMIFQRACKVGLLSIVKILINKPGIKINSCGKYSALHKSIIINDFYLVKILLKSPEFDINQQSFSFIDKKSFVKKDDYNGLTPLEYAIRYGNNEIVKYLLSNDKININKKSQWFGYAPIHVAAFYNNVRAAKILIEFNGIDVNCQTYDEYVNRQNLELVGGRETALHLACRLNNVEIVRVLLENNKIKTDVVDWRSKKPIDCTENIEIKNLLKNH